MAQRVARRKFTVEEYHRLSEAGILGEDDRVELIEGEIVEMSPIGSRHATCVRRLNRLFSRRVSEAALVDVQNPIRLGPHSELQPDLALLRPRADDYATAHPGPEDVLLLVEVAETSADYDRQVKLPLYAHWGIQEVWLVDLDQGCLEVHRDPSPEGYRDVQVVRRGEGIAPAAFPDLEVRAEDVLGPAKGGSAPRES